MQSHIASLADTCRCMLALRGNPFDSVIDRFVRMDSNLESYCILVEAFSVSQDQLLFEVYCKIAEDL